MSAPLGLSSLTSVLYESGQVLSQGALEGLDYVLSVFTSNGTFTPPSAPSGYEIAYFIGTVYGGGYSGDNVGQASGTSGRGGRPGGRYSRLISVVEMGSGQTITIGAGGAARTTDGKGNAGGVTSIGSLLSSSAGSSAIPTPYGDLPSSSAPGWGGDGGLSVDTNSSSGSSGLVLTPGGDGDDVSGAVGGVGGFGASWFGGSSRTPGAGAAGQIVGDHTTGGSGGGGGGAGSGGTSARAQSGAAGGAPGGGGGACGATSSGIGATNPDSGPGGRGQADILTVFKPIAT